MIDLISRIEAATTATALFGADADREYRRLALACHPDQWMREPKAAQERAAKAFLKLRDLRDKPASKPAVFGKWVVEFPLAAGDIADLYRVTSADVKGAVLKIARSPKDNDLMDAEIASLKKLLAVPSCSFHQYIPVIHDTFKASGRRAVILEQADEIPLSDISAKVGKLDFRHAVWMSNRLLSALGFAHKHGIVHGAVVPCHLLYGPESHCLSLIDWCYSTQGKPVPAIVPAYRHLYPKEVLGKQPAMPATDIYMWAAVVRSIADAPRRFNGLLEWCMADSPRHRPSDAWVLQDQLGALAESEYGSKKYLVLQLDQPKGIQNGK